MGLMCPVFIEPEPGRTGEGGSPPSNKRDEGMCIFLLCKAPSANLDIYRNPEED